MVAQRKLKAIPKPNLCSWAGGGAADMEEMGNTLATEMMFG